MRLHTKSRRSPARNLRLFTPTLLLALWLLPQPRAAAQARRRPPAGARVAFVADERLAALRESPGLSAILLRRLGRGRRVALAGAGVTRDGVTFVRVAVTRRTRGWLQAEALVRPSLAGEDGRLLRLARGSAEFDRLARARLFLELFPRSPSRPAALLLFGDAAAEAAARLTREAARRLDAREMEAGGAPAHSYFLNYSGLDRLNRVGARYAFDVATKRFRYDGAAWREILRRHPHAPEAAEARRRLASLAAARD